MCNNAHNCSGNTYMPVNLIEKLQKIDKTRSSRFMGVNTAKQHGKNMFTVKKFMVKVKTLL